MLSQLSSKREASGWKRWVRGMGLAGEEAQHHLKLVTYARWKARMSGRQAELCFMQHPSCLVAHRLRLMAPRLSPPGL